MVQTMNLPYAGLHHRNENLFGIGMQGFKHDISFYFTRLGQLVLAWVHQSPLKDRGRPLSLGALGEPHQHFQMGTGTFIPMVATNIIYQKDDIGVLFSLQKDISLYENKLFYQSGSSWNWNLDFGINGIPRVCPCFNWLDGTRPSIHGEIFLLLFQDGMR